MQPARAAASSCAGHASARSSPLISIVNSSGRITTHCPPAAAGQRKRPFSNRFAQTHSPLPSQHLQPTPRSIREQEQMAAQRILPEPVAHQSEETVESLPHVHTFGSDLGCRTETKHYAAFRNSDQAS